MPLKIINESLGHYAIEGDLTFNSIAKDTIKSLVFLQSEQSVSIDLGRVNNTDSAGLALMIECIKRAKHHGTTLSFCNIPLQLINLAKITGFEKSSYFTDNQPEADLTL